MATWGGGFKEACDFPGDKSIHILFIQTPEEEEILNKKRSKKIQKKYDERKKNAKISSLLEEQFQQGKLLGEVAVGLGWVDPSWFSGVHVSVGG
jgi:hypothetical protein